jgi:hypothetical protein
MVERVTTERIKFPGDPVIKETGSGKGAEIPLSPNVQGTSVEMLNRETPAANKPGKQPRPSQSDDDDDNADIVDQDEGAPEYSRERIGARIGEPVDAAQASGEVEKQLDTEDCVPMLFPCHVKLQDAGIMHSWAPGVHLVPISLAGATPKERHWWLKNNKVRHAGKPMANPNTE